MNAARVFPKILRTARCHFCGESFTYYAVARNPLRRMCDIHTLGRGSGGKVGARVESGTLDVFTQTGGACFSGRVGCENRGCRHNVIPGGNAEPLDIPCAIWIGNAGGVDLDGLSSVLGVTRQGASVAVIRALANFRAQWLKIVKEAIQ